jgi:hypothetical protein
VKQMPIHPISVVTTWSSWVYQLLSSVIHSSKSK